MNETLFQKWHVLNLKLKQIKDDEMAARIALVENMLGPLTGEQKITDDNIALGRSVTATSKLSYNADLEELGIDKSEIQQAGVDIIAGQLPELTDEETACFDVKVSLNISRYKKVEEIAENINSVMIVTAATPTVAVKFQY